MVARFTKVFEKKDEEQQLYVHVQRRRVKEETYKHNKQPAIRVMIVYLEHQQDSAAAAAAAAADA